MQKKTASCAVPEWRALLLPSSLTGAMWVQDEGQHCSLMSQLLWAAQIHLGTWRKVLPQRGRRKEQDYNFRQITSLKCAPGLKMSSLFSLLDFPTKKQEGDVYIGIFPFWWWLLICTSHIFPSNKSTVQPACKSMHSKYFILLLLHTILLWRKLVLTLPYTYMGGWEPFFFFLVY